MQLKFHGTTETIAVPFEVLPERSQILDQFYGILDYVLALMLLCSFAEWPENGMPLKMRIYCVIVCPSEVLYYFLCHVFQKYVERYIPTYFEKTYCLSAHCSFECSLTSNLCQPSDWIY